ncbi:hypothetical protein [Flavobacterium sp. '19STA2R22 D10 B1']|uniref:hypothetical protein n=1 Tax=Flavobacterium aerium TaxID=3037261 RepID=UPI00278C3F1A|nr:hypothetical protein [Flavobacterium sp. '19STA2R22 D10 B1']
MKNSKLFFILIAFIFLSCNSKDLLQIVFKLPKELKEASAVQVSSKSDLIWTIQDSGNEAEIYGLDKNGDIAQTIALAGTPNVDWEDLTSDSEGNLYVGDFGNNDNLRQDLSIYKINGTELTSNVVTPSQKTTFYYPQQKKFPPKKKEFLYDVEAFFLHNNFFYLFTKNRSSQFDGTTFLYKVPNKPGNHAAELIDSYKTCRIFNHCAITSADISPNGKQVVILSNSKIWLLENFKGDNYFSGTAQEVELQLVSQKEGICYKDDSTLLITDERKKKSGGNLYSLDLKSLKLKSKS